MNNSINEVVIVEAIRTPIGAFKGSLKELKYKSAPVAQLDRALGYGPGGSGFDS